MVRLYGLLSTVLVRLNVCCVSFHVRLQDCRVPCACHVEFLPELSVFVALPSVNDVYSGQIEVSLRYLLSR